MWLILGWAIAAAGFTWLAVFRLRRAPALRAPEVDLANVLIIRPLDAPGPHELEALCAPLFGVRQVVASAEKPDVPLEWVASEPLTANRKVGHLLNALEVAPEATVVLCIDADVHVDAQLVHALVGAVRAGAAAASAAPSPSVSGSGLAAKCVRGLLVQSHHSFVALEAMQVGAKAICGKALALSPAALDELRGLCDVVGEDLELAKVLHKRGLSVRLVEPRARVAQSPTLRFADLVARFTRWQQVLRAHRPALYPTVPVLFCPTPGLVMLALLFNASALWLAVAALVLGRFALAARLERGFAWYWLLAEPLLLWCWVRSLFLGRTLTWRGRRYLLEADGRLNKVGVT